MISLYLRTRDDSGKVWPFWMDFEQMTEEEARRDAIEVVSDDGYQVLEIHRVGDPPLMPPEEVCRRMRKDSE